MNEHLLALGDPKTYTIIPWPWVSGLPRGSEAEAGLRVPRGQDLEGQGLEDVVRRAKSS